jgi:hypothetical protein
MRSLFLLLTTIFFCLTNAFGQTLDDWPKKLNGPGWTLSIYQPINESFKENDLKSRCAVSLDLGDDTEPVFGAMWVESRLQTDRDTRMATLESIRVTGLKFPESVDTNTVTRCKEIIEYEVPLMEIEISIDKLLATLEYSEEEIIAAEKISNDPPEIIFAEEPGILVVIDGEPKLEKMEGHDFQRVVNTPFFLIQDPGTKEYYLYSEKNWFRTGSLTGEWTVHKKLNSDLKKLDADLRKNSENTGESDTEKSDVIPDIYIRTSPAELITTEGAPEFAPVDGTSLLYVKNTSDNIFRTIDTQEYYILISGRWFYAKSMKGPWSYKRSDELPDDFSRIPEGSDKDNVLASVAGTNAAKDAILDSQIPQTAVVSRDSATTSVKYDGDPKFERIDGTSLYYAKNTSSTVLMTEQKTYYVCDNGVWFTGVSPNGPWEVATSVPEDVQKIPASSPVYNVKYVYIYESTPTVVYTGYTPGYLGCYHYGPTVVYGTGYYYSGWYGAYYYPRPVTYGFNFHYNPYTGWSMGFSMSFGGPHGWMSFGYGSPYHYGGWWGPPVYRPPYYHRPPYGYYGHRPVHYGNTNVNINRNNNIYVNRGGGGVSSGTRPVTRPSTGRPAGTPSTRPATKPAKPQQPAGRPAQPTTRPSTPQKPQGRPSQPTTRPSSPQQPQGRPSSQPTTRPATPQQQPSRGNVYTDKSGNVYRNNNNTWERNNGSSWQGTQNNNGNLNQMQNNYNRGNTRHNNSNSYSRPQSAPSSRPAAPPSRQGGGRRR